MDHYLNEQQVEELVNFDYVEQDLADLIDDDKSSTSMITLTPTSITEMKPAEVLYQMREMRDTWREQDFRFTADQQAKYDDLKHNGGIESNTSMIMIW